MNAAPSTRVACPCLLRLLPAFCPLTVFPLRNSSRCPRRAGGFHLFLQPRQIDFDQLTQLRERCFKILRRRCVLIDLRLRRARVDMRWRRRCTRTRSLIDGGRFMLRARSAVATQRPQDFVRAFIQRRGARPSALRPTDGVSRSARLIAASRGFRAFAASSAPLTARCSRAAFC